MATQEKLGLLLIQLGSPKTPAVADVKTFLKDFLGDPRVVDSNPLLWKIILNLFVLPSRSPKSAEAYEKIWDGETFPLFKNTEAFAEKLQALVDDPNIELAHSYILSEPQVQDEIGRLKAAGCQKIRVIPLFPQYCEATTLSCKDQVDMALEKHGPLEIDFVESYNKNPAYINEVAAKIEETLAAHPDCERLLMSFHGYPIRRLLGGDIYLEECVDTANLLKERISNIAQDKVILTFQSRFGREPWLEPGTEETLIELAEEGIKKVAVVCPAFVVDNLETEEEIGIGLREVFHEQGGEEFHLVPCLNADDHWVESFKNEIALPKGEDSYASDLQSLPVKRDEKLSERTYQSMNDQKDAVLSPKDNKILKAMFITLFLDLVGFSIIFPLFPQMLDYYRELETGAPGLFTAIIEPIENLVGQKDGKAVIALFGGALMFIYSFLQFFMAPIFGTISDRIGRRPLLIFSITGIAISYVIWFFSGSFLLLVISRLLSGLMGSNITTATAAVADITTEKTRSRGMAYIGIAFGLGFILGPSLGALSTFLPLHEYGNLADYGVNPFSGAALIAFVLTVYNLYLVVKNVPETLAPELRGKGKIYRTANIFKLFHAEKYPGVSKVVWGHFFFLAAFSGAESLLTFLTAERLGYSPRDNGMMFVFVGFIIAMVQGGYVRRKANEVGEHKMAQRGLTMLIPSLALLAVAGHVESNWVLYIALFLMSVGSAMAIPCMTSLVSLYTPASDQGRVLGVFRSLGALARTVGPLAAGILYWKIGFHGPYYAGALAMLLPILIMLKLPVVKKKA